MDALLKVAADTLFTLFVLSLIPGLVYLIQQRTLRGFATYLGLRKPDAKACGIALAVSLVVSGAPAILEGLGLWPELEALAQFKSSEYTTGNQLLATGATGAPLLLAALLKGVVQTALLEEIFFRGFLAKRLIAWLGSTWGNLAQALVFAAPHAAMPFLIGVQEPWLLAAVFGVKVGIMAWVMGYLNEQVGQGSIVPGWIIHGVGNAIAYTLAVW